MANTHVSYCRWALFVYPYRDMYPKGEEQKVGKATNIPNIKSLSFSRSKNSASGSLTLSIVGPVHWAVRPGNWAVLRSSIFAGVKWKGEKILPVNPEDGKLFEVDEGMPRFIGQITSVQTNYIADENGDLRRVTTVRLREWSDILNLSVRFDDFSVAKEFAGNNQNNIGGLALELGALTKATHKDIEELATCIYNAFDFAQVVLRSIGAISNIKMDNPKLAGLKYSYPEISATLPTLPAAMLKDLGIDQGKTASDFISHVFGIQKGKIAGTDKEFYGVYDKAVADDLVQAGDSNKYLERNPKYRPVSLGNIYLLFQGIPAWQMLTQYTDPEMHEVFTDFVYFIDKTGKKPKVGAKPAIFMRDHPWLMERDYKFFKSQQGKGIIWTKYDDLPRITVDSVFIQRLVIGNNFLQAPTSVRVNYTGTNMGANAANYQVLGAFRVPIFLKPEMRRFGGHEVYVQTTFTTQEMLGKKESSSFKTPTVQDLESFWSSLRNIQAAWKTQVYKTASVTLSLKDPGHPLMLGHNLQTTLGDTTLVGHIEAISTSATVDGEGMWSTSTDVELSRVVYAKESGDLEYLPIHQMANLVGESIPFTSDEYDTDQSTQPFDTGGAIEFAANVTDVFGGTTDPTAEGKPLDQNGGKK